MKINHNILILAALLLPAFSFASTSNGTIQNQYAWGENTGWVNFLPDNGNITVTDSGITGYAWDARHGWINMNPTNGGVDNDGEGNLSGSAWSLGGGWIDFDNVSINSSGKFVGVADGGVYGQLTFNCDNCNVTTDWRPLSVRNGSDDEEDDDDESSSSGGGTYIQKILPAGEVAVPPSYVAPSNPDSVPVRNGSNVVDEDYERNGKYLEKSSNGKTTTYTLAGDDTPVAEKQSLFKRIVKTFFGVIVVVVVLRTLTFLLKVLK